MRRTIGSVFINKTTAMLTMCNILVH